MPSTIECPLCKKTLNLPQDGDGLPVRCPACYGVFTLDAPNSVTTNPTPAPAKMAAPAETKRRWPTFDEEEDDYRPTRRYREDDEDFEDIRHRRPRNRPHRAGLIQTLGILSIALCWIPVGGLLGLIGLILAQRDLNEMDLDEMDQQGRGTTQGGRTCAIIGLVLSVTIFGMFLLRNGLLR